jgi:hypothetical protein
VLNKAQACDDHERLFCVGMLVLACTLPMQQTLESVVTRELKVRERSTRARAGSITEWMKMIYREADRQRDIDFLQEQGIAGGLDEVE